jgi:hypothetical protein
MQHWVAIRDAPAGPKFLPPSVQSATRSSSPTPHPHPTRAAGSVIRTLGLIEIQQLPSSSSDDADVARAAPPAPPQQLVNVNNRLVPEETPLYDGDYVVLSRDRVKI